MLGWEFLRLPPALFERILSKSGAGKPMARATAAAEADGREWSLMLKYGLRKRLRVGGFFAGYDSKEDLKKQLTRQIWEHNHGDELLQKIDELEAANLLIHTLEEILSSERRTAQHLQELVHQRVEEGKFLNEKFEDRKRQIERSKDDRKRQIGKSFHHLESEMEIKKLNLKQTFQWFGDVGEDLFLLIWANEEELEAYRDRIREIGNENLELVHFVHSTDDLKEELTRQIWEQLHGNELLQKSYELEAAYLRIQTLEEDLSSERRTAQQLQELVHRRVEEGKVFNEIFEDRKRQIKKSNEDRKHQIEMSFHQMESGMEMKKLNLKQAFQWFGDIGENLFLLLWAKVEELEAYRERIREMRMENLELVQLVQATVRVSDELEKSERTKSESENGPPTSPFVAVKEGLSHIPLLYSGANSMATLDADLLCSGT